MRAERRQRATKKEAPEPVVSDLVSLLVDEVSDYAILTLDLEGRVASWNSGAERIKGYRAAEILGHHFAVFYLPDEAERGLPGKLLAAARRYGRAEHEGWRVRQDGSRFWANVVITALRDSEGVLRGYGKVTRDLSERHASEQDLRASEERFRVAFDHAAVAISTVSLETDDFGTLLSANAAYGELVGRPAAELVGMHLDQLIHPEDLDLAVRTPLARLASGETGRVQFERRYQRSDGEVISTLVTDALYVDATGRRMAIGQILDISERKRFEQQLQHLADHDALTGLYNRRRFEVELERAMRHVRRFGGTVAVLSLDLDGFKFVNDSLGHAAGDALVTRLAGAARRALRETDIIARTGGDEFAAILPHTDEASAEMLSATLLEAIRRAGTTTLEGRHTHVTASIGITTYARGAHLEPEDLIVEADIAMYDAKHEGKDRAAVYHRDEHRRERIVARQDWLRRLKEAIAAERFVLYAQPIVPICSDGVPRYEVLLRLPDPTHELITPGAFLYNAERFGLIEQIDAWVLEQVVRLLHENHQAGNNVALCMNISGKTLNAGGIAHRLSDLLERFPVPEGRLTIEITETAAITNIEQARELARDIRRLGARLALDDFGAGFATFYYLKHLDFDYIKIDGEFIRRLPDNRADQLVVQAVVDIARGLGSDTIAEYVQDDRTTALLKRMGVGYGQGFHLGRPAPVAAQLTGLRLHQA